MSVYEGGESAAVPDDEARRPVLSDRVRWAGGGAGFAYVPHRVLVRGDTAADHLDAITGNGHERRGLGGRDDTPAVAWTVVDDVRDPLAVVALLRADGFEAQPDHVFFAHGCDECCGSPHPSLTFDALASDPIRSNPIRSNPIRSNPIRSNPIRSNPIRSNASQDSSARPAEQRQFPPVRLTATGPGPRVTILDTGLADGAQRPALLVDPKNPARISGPAEQPDVALTTPGGNVWAKDGWLDTVAGHGTFIAGVVEQLAPGCTIRVEQVVSPLGDAKESDVYQAILAQTALPPGQRPDVLSLSFGGSALAQAPALKSAIAVAQLAGIVIVASAGNDGTSEEQYPAAYDDVIAVGALTPDGPAPWTNYGSWVDACAPGTDLVSSFFAAFDGAAPRVNTVDPDHFAGWAVWSGTSFAVPVVVAALARTMVLGSCSAREAVKRVIDAPEALRIRCLGTVVGTA
jgi:hypothetical protein